MRRLKVLTVQLKHEITFLTQNGPVQFYPKTVLEYILHLPSELEVTSSALGRDIKWFIARDPAQNISKQRGVVDWGKWGLTLV